MWVHVHVVPYVTVQPSNLFGKTAVMVTAYLCEYLQIKAAFGKTAVIVTTSPIECIYFIALLTPCEQYVCPSANPESFQFSLAKQQPHGD